MEQRGSTSIATPENQMEESNNSSDEYSTCREDSESPSCDSPWNCLHSPEYYRQWDGQYVMEWNQVPCTHRYAPSSSFSSSIRSSSRIENLDVLMKDLSLESKKLLEAKERVQTKVKDESSKHLVDRAVIDKVQSWFIRVDKSIKLRNRLLRPKFPMNLLQSKQQQNRDASEKKKVMLELMETFLNLKSQAEDFIGAMTQMPQPFRRIELQPHLTGREDLILLRIREFVEDELGVTFIFIPPLYDLTGNKARTLQEFHKKLGEEWKDTGDTFDVVICLEVASSPMSKIQNDLAERLNLLFAGETSFEERTMILHSSLSNYRFLMILDQVESVLNLEELGIPRPPSHSRPSHCSMWSKIIVASPSLDVCKSMGVENWSHWYVLGSRLTNVPARVVQNAFRANAD